MAALCTGISYGLSQSCLSNDNKELIFVKLTDSAYRAIEEYQKNQNKLNSHATIQFLGNDGYLSFPSLSNNCGQKFSFSITETEGLQGSFECIQQTQNQLEVLGSLPNKMRIHANEDVYETTRYRMAVAEETQKNKCTREIKPNQTDIGRKVKVKPSINRPSNIPNNNTLNKQRDSFVNSSSNSLNSNINNNHNSVTTPWLKNNINNSIHQHQQLTQHNSSTTTPITTSSLTITTTTNNSSVNSQTASGLLSSGGLVPSRVANNNIINNNNNNNSSSNRQNNSGHRGNPDIIKRPIKDRLIHLLALRPYKKPELYARISSEGLRDRDKSSINTHLKTISYIRDNTYILHRHMWNDVHEEWPFYTEQDRQILKRRKPQNLTPPLSSDGGSSTSGQSPTSTHNGSPPPAVKRPPLNNDKYSDNGPTSKKQRISHFKKDVNHDNTRRSVVDSRDSANLNPRSRESDELPMRPSHGSSVTPNAQESEDSGLSLSFTVLGTEAAKRISTNSSSISGDQDHEKDNYEEETKVLRQKTNKAIANNNPDFSQYSRITSVEQRRRYKTEFDKDYAEYRRLHADTERVSRKFAQLEEKLRSVSNNDQKYKEIQRQILNEFKQTTRDSEHQEDKKRFQYLHQKLSHIKRLVNDFDSSITNSKTIQQENY